MTEVMSDESLERQIEEFALVPSDGGRFEFSANGKLLYSKLQTGRHVEAGELKKALREFLK
jgi:selT/selW/selH-like putative selenoprotein